jgi:hypothetical protein
LEFQKKLDQRLKEFELKGFISMLNGEIKNPIYKIVIFCENKKDSEDFREIINYKKMI